MKTTVQNSGEARSDNQQNDSQVMEQKSQPVQQQTQNKTQDKAEARREKILNDPLLPLLIKTALPTIIGMLVSMIYNLTDTFVIGLLDNTSMTASVGVVFSFVSIVQALGFWFGYGSGNTMSRCIGAKNNSEAEIISSTGITLGVGTGLVVMILSFIFVKPLSILIGGGASPELLSYTIRYMYVVIPAVPFAIFAQTVYNQLRLCGNVKDGMKGLAVGIFANIILDPILVLVFKMDVLGAGLATTIGQVLSCVVLVVISFKHGNIPVTFKKFSIKKGRLYHILAGGAPNFCRQGITSVAAIMLNCVAGSFEFGDSVIAALTIMQKIAALAYLLMIGFGQGFQPICAMNYGAGKIKRVHSAFRMTVTIGTVFLTISAVVIYFLSENLIHIFSTDSQVLFYGKKLLQCQCFSLPFLAFYAVSSMYMQNMGKYFRSLVISVSRQGLFYIPLLYILSAAFGITGLYWVQPAADVLSFVMAVIVVVCFRVRERKEMDATLI